jgi:hypothetical protein
LWHYRGFVFGENLADKQRCVRQCIVMVKHPFSRTMN